MEITFTDGVLEQIALTIGMRTPETGGALFGPENSDLVSYFVFDKKARTTAASYTPSRELIRLIPEIEAREKIVFKGIIHSHPPGLDRPSGPDHSAFARTLEKNPRLRALFTPIVNLNGGSKHADAHRLNDDATMRVFQAFRSSKSRSVDLHSATVCVMPTDAVTRCVSDALTQAKGPTFESEQGHELINGHGFVRRSLKAGGPKGQKLDLYFPPQFPLSPPLATWTAKGELHWLPLIWQPDQFPAATLAESIAEAVTCVAFNGGETKTGKELHNGKSATAQPRCVA